MLWKRLLLALEMIKFEHSVFALPFAVTGALLHSARAEYPRMRCLGNSCGSSWRWSARAPPRWHSTGWSTRDRRTESANSHAPSARRTAEQGLRVVVCWSRVQSYFWWRRAHSTGCVCSSHRWLSIGLLYSFTKRFTSFSHLVLGFCLGIAPAAAWIAMRGSLDPRILWLTAAVTFWTAGFDIIYSCRTMNSTRRSNCSAFRARSASRARCAWPACCTC